MSKLLVLQGPPASFKSSFARNFIKEHERWIIVNRDSIRESLGEYWVPERENLVSKIERDSIISGIEMGWNVIIDATNLNPKTIAKWEAVADEYKCEIEYKQFWIPFHEAIENDKGPNRNPVGYKVIKSFYERYNPNMLKEDGWDNRYIKELDSSKSKAIICDLDGTLCLHQGRSPYDYEKCDTDKCNEPLIKLLWDLYQAGYHIIFTSGREDIDNSRIKTESWLDSNFGGNYTLLMRSKKDHRPDEIVKEEIYHNEIEPFYNIIAVYDDRNKVCKMWRDLGLLCCQVYDGNF